MKFIKESFKYPMKKIHLIAAARPNFMKIAPLYHELVQRKGIDPVIVHTGQHYDLNMSDVFFKDFDLPEPHIHLNVGSGTHAEQTGHVMMAYEKVLMEEKPDLVVVVGDVNSTIAATLAAVKLGIKTAHLEAGLRSFDRTMPEEINRIVTDSIADFLWTPSVDGDENLIKAGIAKEKVTCVGNIMIDSLEMLRSKIENLNISGSFGLSRGSYGLVTLHRPSNVDTPEILEKLCTALSAISLKIPLIFPVHPRTLAQLKETGLESILQMANDIHLTDPLGYKDFMNLVMGSRLLITDSGGVQEETTYLGIPCLTLRSNTERPITITQGTNLLCSHENISRRVDHVLEGTFSKGRKPALWDGHTASRVADCIQRVLSRESG
ncbi:UDP-N-acetylglucosamine 2-epimerase (non-hydrolyzing) [Desulfobacula sp.]|uniref:non-hydrolyzing UDP-N-acetylglucosamine 2-epimerase n=1 Tax=Desulfobacula sp. TaxID=2593537 RepID=UPI00260AC398|nr:UDP-N-acetylglucosamine 2-epimerase (non-hydrolyzing) [Desulfobacula sp.]